MHDGAPVDAVVHHKGMEEIHGAGLSQFSGKLKDLMRSRVRDKGVGQPLLLQALLHEIQQISEPLCHRVRPPLGRRFGEEQMH